ncbi:hypothetical protein [Hymenobacter chitinivorans]|uniref:Uncharacterized protein n=1 Tax=Hymenobacter chitinivorans DSM 11115 TaxID=1121954 RepID=A0A2M9APS8_9BACT|nr:hypothetical protein [Hymenobacter chitinivorans]PJJ47717.1 hypothetical protein CLV45_4855 [Hymenobacter chitinivorans DSM 11115]
MKNIDATQKFDFKKTTITVFSKQSAAQGKYSFSDDSPMSTMICNTSLTSVWTSTSLIDTQ